METLTAPVTRQLRVEMLVVLGISLGQSAVYSLLSLINKLTLPVALNQQTTSMNTSATPDRPWLDLAYQVAGLVFPLMPVVLVLYLLWALHRPEGGPFRAMGFTLEQPAKDLGWGFATFAGIGVAGLAFYFAARELGINTSISAANLTAAWWTIPVLVLRAVMNGILEEVVMLGYLFTRWRQSGGGVVAVLLGSALIRGGYHLYQGFGGFIGNAVMGVLFGWVYLKTKRVMPLVICHALLDIFAFVGYALLKPYIAWL
ncbi:CPBP family intramembrane glutamic endopeptidase [Tessaracoccus antarcticus]|uniref:CPBP family intramembrane metalloprotease n=1 Tax=Tessaracoccus antarcticus TaxID=2479848 RepID=A0A3M0G857_9ACTN|nr:CPBP family intramembrane glutamic endopeptidase [Tessaracoccus antarcticus]RMB61145.1 CPBP family intramembrane metalloprotease [Tessaracoccus antarcticus]